MLPRVIANDMPPILRESQIDCSVTERFNKNMPTTARFTSEALENMRHRYVETDEPLMRIGSDFGISDKTVLRIAKRENWPMRASRLRDLPLHVKLSIEAENAARAEIQSSSE